ncbi:tetratricopeptide repeat protein [Bradyrhizobium pachyrhizi]|uniref:Tetratricopeptide repeat protein n=1 Tax=Bradyrhizobium pachyrhizi TaxID=280333 RepID=A0A844SY36_9BRAD|nr:tetratricopeptide repeat protein [Bradyrhizobium pachyrhizi]
MFVVRGGVGSPRSLRAQTATTASPIYVGSEVCSGCHQAQAAGWQTSQHKHAMQHASTASVLGNFEDARFDYFDLHSRFFRKDGKFLVETDGPDGKLAIFEVKYTFGIDPLQQYLIEFPDGRLQALSIAWDSRPKDQGGQRWFHLYPNEQIKHDDVLHWTKLNQNWNFMCAECHSTGVQKNYDAISDRFHTTWTEINVGCEACHGKGSRHVDWARSQESWFKKNQDPRKGLAAFLDERDGVTWQHDPKTGNPQRSIAPATTRREVEICGLCHARRGQFSEEWVPGEPLSDTHTVSLLDRGLYHADGQMRDEVYNYGSFKQSRMFAAGVTCGDCHEPHTAKLRAPGDGVCLQCHASDKYEVATHTHHDGATPKVTCASCHMPVSTYMVIDKRHDHSLRIPRPDLSVKLGTPNACNDCHTDKSAQWAADAVEHWHGPTRKGFQNYAEAFQASWTNRPDATALLELVAASPSAPAIARASALSEMQLRVSPANIELARKGLVDPDPMVRIGALDMIDGLPGNGIWPLVSPHLSDPSRGVRIRAVSVLAAVPTANQPAADRAAFDRAVTEFVAAQKFNSDRPEARTTLGSFYVRRGLTSDAEDEYIAALRLSPQYAPAAINLSDLYRQLGRNGDGERVLRATIGISRPDAGLHYALGLTLTREKRPDDALAEFRAATEIEPERSHYAYVYGVALHSSGRMDESMTILKGNLSRHPGDRETLLALIAYSRDAEDIGTALGYAEQLSRFAPNDRDITRLTTDLRARSKR